MRMRRWTASSLFPRQDDLVPFLEAFADLDLVPVRLADLDGALADVPVGIANLHLPGRDARIDVAGVERELEADRRRGAAGQDLRLLALGDVRPLRGRRGGDPRL